MKEEELATESGYPEIEIIRETESLKTLQNEKIKEEDLKKFEINMEFLGLDLSQVPIRNKTDWKVFIIPVLYVAVSFISMKMSVGKKDSKKEKKNLLSEDNSKVEPKQESGDMQEAMDQVNQNMSMIFPIMYLSIAIIAPLGLALYWLINSILMIAERLILNKVIKDDE